MKNNIRLGVNIDHVATIRNARGGKHPDITKAAIIAEASGADLITIHIREDRRHVNEKDLKDILKKINIPLNLELAAKEEMVNISKKYNPNYLCFVPEKREEVTTEGGLDVKENFNDLKKIITPLLNRGIKITLFIDADHEQLKATRDLGVKKVEFHTGPYANSFSNLEKREIELEKIKSNVLLAKKYNIESHAGHGLNFDNVAYIALIPDIVELNIGHFLIGESIFQGLSNSISKMRKIIDEA